MESVSIDDAKTQLAQLVDKAAVGEDVVISLNGKPLVRITRLRFDGPQRRIKFGLLKGKFSVSSNFDAPLPNAVVNTFERRD